MAAKCEEGLRLESWIYNMRFGDLDILSHDAAVAIATLGWITISSAYGADMEALWSRHLVMYWLVTGLMAGVAWLPIVVTPLSAVGEKDDRLLLA